MKIKFFFILMNYLLVIHGSFFITSNGHSNDNQLIQKHLIIPDHQNLKIIDNNGYNNKYFSDGDTYFFISNSKTKYSFIRFINSSYIYKRDNNFIFLFILIHSLIAYISSQGFYNDNKLYSSALELQQKKFFQIITVVSLITLIIFSYLFIYYQRESNLFFYLIYNNNESSLIKNINIMKFIFTYYCNIWLHLLHFIILFSGFRELTMFFIYVFFIFFSFIFLEKNPCIILYKINKKGEIIVPQYIEVVLNKLKDTNFNLTTIENKNKELLSFLNKK